MKRVQSAFDRKATALGKSRSGLLSFRRSRSDVVTDLSGSDSVVAMAPILANNTKSPSSKSRRGSLHAAMSFLRSKSGSKKQTDTNLQDRPPRWTQMDSDTATDSSGSGITLKKSNCHSSRREMVALLQNGSYNVRIVLEGQEVDAQDEVEVDNGLEVSLDDFNQTCMKAPVTENSVLAKDAVHVPRYIETKENTYSSSTYGFQVNDNTETPFGIKQSSTPRISRSFHEHQKKCNPPSTLDHPVNDKSDSISSTLPINSCSHFPSLTKHEVVSPTSSIQHCNSLACNEYMGTYATYR
jgi:hypothetical protein